MRRGERRGFRRGLGAVAIAVATVLVAQIGATNASWNDAEWVDGAVGAVDCTAPDDAFATRGVGRALSGSLLGIDLDALAEASGVTVTNDGTRDKVSPAGANAATGEDAWANPLNVTALSAINVNLGSGMLQLPLNNSTGVLGQFGQAQDTGFSAGAAGYVTDSGGIGLEPANGYPRLATLRLSQLLASINPAVAGLLTNVSDVSLEVGAVAGRAALDGCETVWSGASALAASLSREYLAASADTVITSPTVGALVTALSGVINGLQPTLDGLENTLKATIQTGIGGLLNGLLGTLSLGSVTVDTLTLSIDTSPVAALLTTTIADDAGIVSIDLAAGTITVNTAALIGSAFADADGVTLNGLDPNTNLLSDPAIATALSTAVTAALADWLGDVDAALQAALDGIRVQLHATIVLRAVIAFLTVDVAKITIGLDGRLGSLGTTQAIVGTEVLGGLIPESLLTPLVSPLVSGVGGLVGGIIKNALPTVASLTQVLNAPIAAIVNVVALVYNTLYLSGVVALVVNAQNDPLTGSAEPADWAGLPAGRYDVAALRIGVLGALGNADVRLYLGRGSVGRVCSLAQAPVLCQNY